jgi:cytochrome c-L
MNLSRIVRLIVQQAVLAGSFSVLAHAQEAQVFRHTITGEDLKVLETSQLEGRDTEAVRQFLATGINPYLEREDCLEKGHQTFLSSCSGCHGHLGEGKVGPGLNDAYWTYPKNRTDKGLFETIYGGASGMMGPHNDLQLDEILGLMAWVRHLYNGPVEEADWLSGEQKMAYKPYAGEEPVAHAECKISAKESMREVSGKRANATR